MRPVNQPLRLASQRLGGIDSAASIAHKKNLLVGGLVVFNLIDCLHTLLSWYCPTGLGRAGNQPTMYAALCPGMLRDAQFARRHRMRWGRRHSLTKCWRPLAQRANRSVVLRRRMSTPPISMPCWLNRSSWAVSLSAAALTLPVHRKRFVFGNHLVTQRPSTANTILFSLHRQAARPGFRRRDRRLTTLAVWSIRSSISDTSAPLRAPLLPFDTEVSASASASVSCWVWLAINSGVFIADVFRAVQ